MSESLQLSFAGGKWVDVHVGDCRIPAGQSEKNGVAGSAPAPYTLFLAALVFCSDIIALNFCQSRGIATIGLVLSMEWHGDWARSLARAEARRPTPRRR
jgi:uncharacterized OsmC-like protein